MKTKEKIIQESKNEAKSYFNQARSKILKDINIKKDILEKELNKEIEKIENEILQLRAKAPEKIKKIAIEISSDLLKHLIGAEVNSSSISAIVDDLSKKKGNKYYGN